MAKKSNRRKKNIPKKFDRIYLENSVWALHNDYELLFNYWGEIWSIKDRYSNFEGEEMRVGNWEFINTTLTIRITDIPNHLIDVLTLGSYTGFPSRYCSTIDFKILRGRNGWVTSFRVSRKFIVSKPQDLIKGYGEDSYLGNFISKDRNYPKWLIDRKNLVFKEPFYLFIDIETNGLPESFPDPSSNPEEYPEIIQIAIIYCDSNGKRICQNDQYFVPKGWAITEDTRRFLNIDEDRMETIRRFGVFIINPEYVAQKEFYNQTDPKPIVENLIELFGVLSEYEVKYIIGHNLEYDLKCLQALYYRHLKDGQYSVFTSNFNSLFIKHLPNLQKICTMKGTIDFCGIKSQYGYKYPKLEELYKKLFSEDLDDSHNAKYDVFNTAKCYWRLRDREIMIGINDDYDKEISKRKTVKRVKITELNLTGENEGIVHYQEFIGNALISSGKAYCTNIDATLLDEDDFLTEQSWLSKDGTFLYNSIRLKVTKVTLTGVNEGFIDYEQYVGKTIISRGKAYCSDLDAAEIDGDNFLIGQSWLSKDGKVLFNTKREKI